jgi:4-hydroxy-3-polyprenylbenzoate decarboxylase
VSRFFVGITGGSGHPYAVALVRALLDNGQEVDTSITDAGLKVLQHEVGLDAGPDGARLARVLEGHFGQTWGERLRSFASKAIEAPPSSGTALTGGVVLCPCSMGTLARVSVGFSSNLVERAADVALKERRPLVLVVREAPYSSLHLENMLRLSRLGAVILPASPGFYHRPKTLDDVVEHVVGKVLDTLRVPHSVGARWKGLPRPDEDEGTGRPAPRDPLGEDGEA